MALDLFFLAWNNKLAAGRRGERKIGKRTTDREVRKQKEKKLNFIQHQDNTRYFIHAQEISFRWSEVQL